MPVSTVLRLHTDAEFDAFFSSFLTQTINPVMLQVGGVCQCVFTPTYAYMQEKKRTPEQENAKGTGELKTNVYSIDLGDKQL